MPALTSAFAQGLAADRPAAASANAGYYWLSTDTAGGTLYQSTGSGWVQVAAAVGVAGSVTSVAVSAPSPLSSAGGPVTSSGTIALTWATGQAQNRVLASPDGSSGAVALRALVAADIPSLPASQIASGQLAPARGGTGLDTSAVTDGQVLIGQSSDHTLGLAALTAGSGVSITNAGHSITVAATGGGGTVTSVALTAPGFLSVSGSPVTGAGTLAVTLATQAAGAVFAGPASGSAAAPTFRALAVADVAQPVAASALLYAASTCL